MQAEGTYIGAVLVLLPFGALKGTVSRSCVEHLHYRVSRFNRFPIP